MRVLRLVTLSLGSAVAASAAPAEGAPVLAQHRAVYDLVLNNASDRSGITGLTGRMVYEFRGSACEGYAVKFRFVTQIDSRENTRLTDQQTTTFEDAEGKSFDFVNKSFIDQKLDKEVKGAAKLDGKGLKVMLDRPSKSTVELASTRFPTQHLVELIDKAEKGETFYETDLFDGSEDADKVMTTTVVVGKQSKGGSGDPEAGALADRAGETYWPVDIAYFDLSEKGGEELPEYRISFKLHENGVTRDLVMDYGDFSMKGKLVELSVFDAPKDCAK